MLSLDRIYQYAQKQKSWQKATTTQNKYHTKDYLWPNGTNTPPYFGGLKRRIFLCFLSWIRDCVDLRAKLYIFLHMCKREGRILQDLVLQTFARDGLRQFRGGGLFKDNSWQLGSSINDNSRIILETKIRPLRGLQKYIKITVNDICFFAIAHSSVNLWLFIKTSFISNLIFTLSHQPIADRKQIIIYFNVHTNRPLNNWLYRVEGGWKD